MCDDQDSSLQKTVQSPGRRVPKITIRGLKGSMDGDQAVNIKAEEFSDIADGEDPVPKTLTGIKAEHERDVPGSHSEAFRSSAHDGDQAVNVKVEEFSDVEYGEDPLPMTVVEIKAEPEDYTDSQEDVLGSCIETYPTTSYDPNQTINIKVEEFSDVEEEEDPVPIQFPGIEAEHVSVMNEYQFIHAECPFSCNVCNKSFTSSSGLKRHQRIHTTNRSFSCDVCNKSFSRHGHLKEHLHVHSGERAFSCDVCNKSFTTNNVLKVHQRIHREERPFSCALCNKSYLSKNQLKVHLRTHSGERPFSCNMCNKSFIRNSNLKAHQRIHSGERPFSCDVCSKSFSQNSHLKVHQRICSMQT